MPHSGGGGSHSGGSHSSSHGGSGGSSRRVSSHYFHGAHRYIYYYNNQPCVYYSTSPDANPRSGGVFMLLFGLFWTAFTCLFVLLMVKYKPAGPLPLDYDTAIVIQDDLGVIEDETALRKRFEDFQKETGITFSVMVCTPRTATPGETCESQSYHAYLANFQDESHWLVYYVGSERDRSDNWEWNLMCGDDCTSVLNSRQEDAFTATFHRELTKNGSFDKAVITAVDRLSPDLSAALIYRENVQHDGENVGGQKLDAFPFVFFGIFFAVGFGMLIGAVVLLLTPADSEAMARHHAFRTPDPTSELREAACGYCGSTYYEGTVSKCPFCGTPVPEFPYDDYRSRS